MPKAKGYLRGRTSFSTSLQIARDELSLLFPPGTEIARHASYKHWIHYRHCEIVWELVRCSTQICGQDKSVNQKEVTVALTKLAKTKPERGQEVLNRPRMQPSRAGSRPAIGSNNAGVWANLRISDEDRQRYLNRWDKLTGVAPRAGLLKCPVTLWLDNLRTLTGTEWLDDNVVDSYLSLVCHTGNGHFKMGKDSDVITERPPTWHAWPVWFFTDVADRHGIWPPEIYPGARLEDVKHHFFPRCSAAHWYLFHVYHHDHTWHADFYSSLPSYYGQERQNSWPTVVKAMKELSSGVLDLSTVKVQFPKSQPLQSNSYDCGVLILCVARWLMEGFPMDSLLAQDCPQFRQRMIVELEKWSLD